jgi:hypothetical protein
MGVILGLRGLGFEEAFHEKRCASKQGRKKGNKKATQGTPSQVQISPSKFSWYSGRGTASQVQISPSMFSWCSATPVDIKTYPTSQQICIGKQEVSITADAGIELGKALEASQFKTWVDTIAREERIKIAKIHIQSMDMFADKVDIIKLKVDATIHNKQLPGTVCMLGGKVAVLPILHCRGQKFTLLVRQARVPIAQSCVGELPDGVSSRLPLKTRD